MKLLRLSLEFPLGSHLPKLRFVEVMLKRSYLF